MYVGTSVRFIDYLRSFSRAIARQRESGATPRHDMLVLKDPDIWLILHDRTPGIRLVLTESEVRLVRRGAPLAFDIVRAYESATAIFVTYDVLETAIEV